MAELLTEDVVMDDGRQGLATLAEGRDAVLAWFGALEFDDHEMHLRATRGEHLSLHEMRFFMTGFVVDALLVLEVDDDGRGKWCGLFEVDDLDAAISELERRHRARERATRTTDVLGPAELENASSRSWRAAMSAVSEGDFTWCETLLAPDCVAEDLRPGLVNRVEGRDDVFGAMCLLHELGVRRVDADVVALRGERLALLATVVGGRTFEVEALFVNEIGEHGLMTWSGTYTPEQLDDALSELEARFLAGEGAPHASWLAPVLPWTMLHQARRDWDGLRSVYADDVVFVDRRLASNSELVGRDALIEFHQVMVELAPSHRGMVRRVLAIENRAVLFEFVTGGTAGPHEGGRYETVSLAITQHAVDGRIRRFEMFDVQETDRAWARFRELTAHNP
jgi:hypothetical protein